MTFLGTNPWHDVPQEEIVYCLRCGKKIWVGWKKGEKLMKFCANDFFGR